MVTDGDGEDEDEDEDHGEMMSGALWLFSPLRWAMLSMLYWYSPGPSNQWFV